MFTFYLFLSIKQFYLKQDQMGFWPLLKCDVGNWKIHMSDIFKILVAEINIIGTYLMCIRNLKTGWKQDKMLKKINCCLTIVLTADWFIFKVSLLYWLNSYIFKVSWLFMFSKSVNVMELQILNEIDMIFEPERNWCFCQDFVSRQKEGQEFRSLEVREASSSHLKTIVKK